jgi:hypothetical protein
MTFGAQCPALEEGLLVPHTLVVHVPSGICVIDRPDDEVHALPEGIVEVLLAVWTYFQFQ